MSLTLPKQQITGNLGINNISGTVTLPMQEVSAVAVMPFFSGTVGIPAQQITGNMTMPGLYASVPIPMQQITATAQSLSITGSVSVPMQRIAGLEPEIDAEINMPMQSVVAWMEQPILGIPMQQVAGHAVVPLVITDAPIAIPMQQFPVFQTGDIAGPAPLITGSAMATNGYWMAGTAPLMTGAATAIAGASASMSGVATAIASDIAVYAPATMAGSAIMSRSDIAASSGIAATIAASAPLHQSAIAATTGVATVIASTAPLIAASSIEADAQNVTTMAGAPAMVASSIGASVGVALSIDSVMPSGAASAMQIWVRPEISMASSAPMIQSSIRARAIAQAVKILAMNLKLGAVTEFQSEIEFESVAALDGVVYVAGPDGVYAMTGADDDGEAFAQSALFGMLDYGSSQKKHPDSVLIEASASAAPVVTVHVGATSNAYTSIGPKRNGMYRAKVGRGLTGKRMQFEVSGTGIESVSSVDVLVEPGKRAF